MELADRIYDQLLGFFPSQYHWAVSLVVLLFLLVIFLHFIRKSMFFLILLIIFVPASVPVLKNLLSNILGWFQQQL